MYSRRRPTAAPRCRPPRRALDALDGLGAPAGSCSGRFGHGAARPVEGLDALGAPRRHQLAPERPPEVTAARRTGRSTPATTAPALDALAPSIARAAAPPLPPRERWTPAMIELHTERVCIAAEGGSRDALAVADLDLRVALRRGEVEGPTVLQVLPETAAE